MYTAATEFHSSPLPKLQLLTDVTIGQFSFGLSGDNIVNIICIFITNLLNFLQSIVKFVFKPVVSSLFGDCSFKLEIDLLSKKVLSLLGHI